MINKIPGSRLLISSLPGKALRTLVNIAGLSSESACVLKAEPGKLDIERPSHLVFSIYLASFGEKKIRFVLCYMYAYVSN